MELTAINVRKRILKMANNCGRSTHIGGSLSMVELLTVLYRDMMSYKPDNPSWDDRDRFILSKGHCVLALYAVLGECGLIKEQEMGTYLQDGSNFGSHPVMDLEHGIESSNGSLGQGISMAVGLAKAAKLKNQKHKIYVLIGNGECNEGTVWEAAMLAAQWKLDNLTVILDNNKLQSDGYSDGIIDLSNVGDRFSTFGFCVKKVDGHSEKEVLQAYRAECSGKPKIIIGETVKGKGISFMENNNEWHHNRLTNKIYMQALNELEVHV
ncbi:transketolase [bacterium C-53]|nr:transketolase [Lachnospiraceae bacterium]NBI02669.1 transketolase [Lachnospiraceae bacterium]RKJ11307.1 transketolase [bacterium C-53]